MLLPWKEKRIVNMDSRRNFSSSATCQTYDPEFNHQTETWLSKEYKILNKTEGKQEKNETLTLFHREQSFELL